MKKLALYTFILLHSILLNGMNPNRMNLTNVNHPNANTNSLPNKKPTTTRKELDNPEMNRVKVKRLLQITNHRCEAFSSQNSNKSAELSELETFLLTNPEEVNNRIMRPLQLEKDFKKTLTLLWTYVKNE